MFAWIINFIKRLFLGQTDVNRNNIPDNKEILKLIQSMIDKELKK